MELRRDTSLDMLPKSKMNRPTFLDLRAATFQLAYFNLILSLEEAFSDIIYAEILEAPS